MVESESYIGVTGLEDKTRQRINQRSYNERKSQVDTESRAQVGKQTLWLSDGA